MISVGRSVGRPAGQIDHLTTTATDNGDDAAAQKLQDRAMLDCVCVAYAGHEAAALAHRAARFEQCWLRLPTSMTS